MSATTESESSITVPKSKLICLLKALLKETKVEVQPKNRKHRLGEVVAAQTSDRPSESFQRPHPEGWDDDPLHAMSYMARVLNMATQLSTTHRWDGNVKLFSALARQISHCPIVIWKVGAQCLSNHRDGRDDLLRSFANTMVQVGKNAAPEIMFDYATHLMSIGEYQDAKKFLETYRGKCGHKASPDMRVILQGFRGTLEYIDWFQKRNAEDVDCNLPGNQLAAISNEAEIAAHADRAIVHFDNFSDCRENCDCFMSLVVELLEYYNRIDELEKVLQAYLRFNENHPSPFVFMYDFLTRHYPEDIERKAYVLEELAYLCPSHPYIIELCKLLPDEEFARKVQFLACMVDYDQWRNDVEVWQQMATILINPIRCENANPFHTLRRLWNDRSTWWPSYHFLLDDINVIDHTNAEVAMFKAIVVACMFDTKHIYVLMVTEKLESCQFHREMNYLLDKLPVTIQLNVMMKVRTMGIYQDPPMEPWQRVTTPATRFPRPMQIKRKKKKTEVALELQLAEQSDPLVFQNDLTLNTKGGGSKKRKAARKWGKPFTLELEKRKKSKKIGQTVPKQRRPSNECLKRLLAMPQTGTNCNSETTTVPSEKADSGFISVSTTEEGENSGSVVVNGTHSKKNFDKGTPAKGRPSTSKYISKQFISSSEDMSDEPVPLTTLRLGLSNTKVVKSKTGFDEIKTLSGHFAPYPTLKRALEMGPGEIQLPNNVPWSADGNSSLREESDSSVESDSSDSNDNASDTRQTINWNGKSLIVHSPIKLKNLSVVLERLKSDEESDN